MIKVNGQFPGPPLICDEDDDVEITVHNHMPFNNSVHWHGMMYVYESLGYQPWLTIDDARMQGTPWSDGAPGLSQQPIEIGQSFVYRFKASPAGTHW